MSVATAEKLNTRSPEQAEGRENNNEKPTSGAIIDSAKTLDIYHTPEGKMRTRLKNGDHVAAAYVDTGAIIATHESRITDAEIEKSSEVSELINNDENKEADLVGGEQVEESKKEGTFANVFARAFRRITTEFGRESIVTLASAPDIRYEEGNAEAINTAIESGLAFVIPEGIEGDIIAIFREESKAVFADSDERTVDNIFTGAARVMGNGMGIPIRANGKNPTYMYFMYGKTKDQKIPPSATDEVETPQSKLEAANNNTEEDSSTVAANAA